MFGNLVNTARNRAVRCLTALILILASGACPASESSWKIVAEPDWGSQAKVNPALARGIRGGQFYNVVERHHRYGLTAESQTRYVRYIYTIVNAAGLDSGANISIDFDPSHESVELHTVKVHRGDTEIDQIDADKIQLLQRETELDQGLYNGELTLHMLLPDQRVGDRVEISYSVIGGNPVFENKVFGWASLQASVPVGNFFFRLHHPATKQVKTRTYAGDIEPERVDINGYKQLTWENYNATGKKYQSNVPASFTAQTEIQYSEFETWPDVATWAEPLYRTEPLSDELKSYVSNLKSRFNNTEDQIGAAINFVQDDVRYTGLNSGIGGYKPDSPSDIYHRRFGDCKDKAVLMVAILKALGVTAHPALVHSSSGKAIPGYLPSPDAFNHMIVYVPDHNNQSYWIDGTINLQGSSLQSLQQGNYHNALIPALHEKGLVNYQVVPSALPEKEVTEAYHLRYNHDPAPTKLTVTSIFRGYEAEYLRRKIHNSSIYSLQDNYLDFYRNSHENIERVSDFEFSDNRKANTITMVEQYAIPNALEYQEDESNTAYATFMFSVYAETITGDLQPPSDTRRRQPLAQIHPVHVKHQITITHEDGWLIEDETFAIKNPQFEFTASNTREGEYNFVLNYELKTLTDTVSVADSRDYLSDLQRMLDSPYYGVTFSVSRANTNTSRLDSQLISIGKWFQQNLDQLGTQSTAVDQ